MKLLSENFVNSYKTQKPDWGFTSGPNSLGEITYRRTYSRDGEQWWETVLRVVEGVYEIIEDHCAFNHIPFDPTTAQYDAERMYHLMFNFKFLPPGRGLWSMGTPFIKQRKTGAPLNNCAFTSTADIKVNPTKSFEFMMDMSMLGVGVGFDTKGAGMRNWADRSIFDLKEKKIEVEDSREGWVDALRQQILWAFGLVGYKPVFDYSNIRPKGAPIHGFGGVAPGSQPLETLIASLEMKTAECCGNEVTSRDLVDIMNMIGVAVVAGGIRRTAQIVFGEDGDKEYANLKNYKLYPERQGYGWASNNSVFVSPGANYKKYAKRIRDNGEPGFYWLENAQRYGRMVESPNNKDWRVSGGNPCLEQSLEDQELCCLVETFPFRHNSLEEYKETLKYAYLYAKAVTLVPTHWKESNAVMLRNRRIGTSMSGVAQFIAHRGKRELIHWCSEGYKTIEKYDRVYSEWLCIRESIKKTSIKPSGTVSLLAGATPGCHYPVYNYYLRRIRFQDNHPDIISFKEAGYHVEPSVNEPNTMIVSFPVKGDPDIPTEQDVSLGEKISVAVLLQKYWADNQVSCTATFNRETEWNLIPDFLAAYDTVLKGISFLPLSSQESYPQMPYEPITKDQYDVMVNGLKEIKWQGSVHDQDDMFCDGAACTLPVK